MGQVKFTTEEIEKVLDGRYNSFRQALIDGAYTVGSPRALAAGTEYKLTNNGSISNDVTSPTYFTDRWDTTNFKMSAITELDTPTFVNDISFTFDPTVSAAGVLSVRVYIDESGTQDFSTDPLIRTYTADYKASPEPISIVSTWFFGETAGFDAKNNGVYFTIESAVSGNLYDTFFAIYRT